MGRGAWWATVHGVTKIRKRLSTHTKIQNPQQTPNFTTYWSNLFYFGAALGLCGSMRALCCIVQAFSNLVSKLKLSCSMAGGILVPWPGIEPPVPYIERWILNHWTPRAVPSHVDLRLPAFRTLRNQCWLLKPSEVYAILLQQSEWTKMIYVPISHMGKTEAQELRRHTTHGLRARDTVGKVVAFPSPKTHQQSWNTSLSERWDKTLYWMGYSYYIHYKPLCLVGLPW